jgi:phenylacetate-CoA ligase
MSGAPLALEDVLHPWVNRYLGAPGWVLATAGRMYACLPPSLRYGRAYGEFRAALDATRDAASARALALAKLEETLAWALDTVPAYQDYRALAAGGRDPRGVLRALPVTHKLDIKRHPARYLSRAMPASARLTTYTGGSTRTPMQFWLQKHVTRPREYAFMREVRDRVGAGEGDMVLALRGRTVASAARPGGRPWMYEPVKRQLVISSEHLARRFLPLCAEALARFRPPFIEAFPSALYPLARWLEAHPLPEFTRNVRGITLYSENVYGFQMETLKRVFGCPIVAHYGHSERVLMAATLPGDERYFFWPQYGWLELLDAQDRPITEPGKLGFVVGTSFDNRVMPFVRYRTGDLAMLSGDGRLELAGYPAVERIAGRLQEFVVCRDERLVSITALGVAHFPELAAVEAIQYEQHKPGELILKVAAEGEIPARDLRRMATAVAAKTQGGCDVGALQVERIERTPRGKSRMLVQHLDVRRYFGLGAEA